MNIDRYGRVTITQQEAFNALYTGKLKNLNNVIVDGDIDTYNQARQQNADQIPALHSLENLFDISVEEFDEINQNKWFMPEGCFEFPIVDFLHSKCTTEEERVRVEQELVLFVNHGMLDLLFYLKYLVDTMRANNIVWGVGRGSSVASYILYLLGVHKINSIKYNLDIHEFLKEI